MANVRIKRAVQPAAYSIRIEPDPESADARAKRLVVWLPLEGEEWLMPLNEPITTYLHDATSPGWVDTNMVLPEPPDGVG